MHDSLRRPGKPVHISALMSQIVSLSFVAFLLLMVGLKYWLAWRQVRHVGTHAATVPKQFADRVSLEAHRKAAAYTIAKTRFAVVETAVSAMALVGLTLLGGLQWLSDTLHQSIESNFAVQLALVIAVAVLLGILDLPFSW